MEQQEEEEGWDADSDLDRGDAMAAMEDLALLKEYNIEEDSDEDFPVTSDADRGMSTSGSCLASLQQRMKAAAPMTAIWLLSS